MTVFEIRYQCADGHTWARFKAPPFPTVVPRCPLCGTTTTKETLPMSPDAPPRSIQQRRDALQRANRVRSLRAAYKYALAAGAADLRDELSDVPDWLETMKIGDALLAVPGVGKEKLRKWLTTHSISPSKTVEGLSDRQRAAILLELTALAERRRKSKSQFNGLRAA